MSADGGSIAAIADALADTFPGCEDAPLTLALVRELARAEPVATTTLATLTGRGETEVNALLGRWPTVQRDEHGRVVAFSGLSLPPTPHGFEVDGRQLYAWCAWDTLFLPAMLGAPARVRSRCPVTGAAVRLAVALNGVRAAEPDELAVSFPPADAVSSADITGSFCCHVHFLAGPHAAEQWRADHPASVVLALDDAFELGQRATRRCRPATLAPPEQVTLEAM